MPALLAARWALGAAASSAGGGSGSRAITEQCFVNVFAAFMLFDFAVLDLNTTMIAHHGDEKFAKLIEGLAESLEGRLEERKAFWRSLAARTDHLFLFLLPGTYTVFLILMYSAPSALAPSPD